jgi:MFS family permease
VDLSIEATRRKKSLTDISRTRARVCVAVISCGALAGSLVQTLVVPILGIFPTYFDASQSTIAWIVTITLLCAGMFTPLLARLGDRYGRKRLLVIATAILTAGSLLCALSPSLIWLLVGRGMQGAGMAIVPLGISLVAGMPRLSNVNTSIGVVSAVMGFGGAVGLPMAGIVTRVWDFHAVFWVTAVTAAVAGLGVCLLVPEAPRNEEGSLDLFGILLFATFLVSAFFMITNVPSWGLLSAATIGSGIGTFVVLLPLLIFVELRAEQPAVDLRVLSAKPVLLTNMASILAGFTMFENFYTTTQLVQVPKSTGYGFGFDSAAAGLCVLPTGLAVVLCAPASGALISRLGPRVAMLIGLCLLGVGSVVRLAVGDSLTLILVSSTIIGVGTSVAFSAMPVLVMRSTPTEKIGAAAGLNTLARTIGSALASAIAGLVLTADIGGTGGQVPGQSSFWYLSAAAAASMVVAMGLILAVPRERDPRPR